ncbi:MAG TPA: M14 family zinc carboxypeptidase [Ignavibacteria bacterium]|nr:M14 family zinc carboxypeptidase [Ignavibacteria bacterium]
MKLINKLKLPFLILLLAFFVVFSGSKTDDRERNLGDINKTLQVKIYESGDVLSRLSKMGLAVDHVHLDKADNSYMAYLNGHEVKLMKDAGIMFDIVYGDWYEDYYTKLPKMSESEMRSQMNTMQERTGVTGFGYGSMGGFYTYDEVIRKLDSMRINHPTLISAKFVIGTTFTGKPVYAYKITKDPDIANTRPQVLYTALIHAREAITVMNLMYLSYYLLENYDTDEAVRYLVDNRELYFIPFVNPDGYRYNQKFFPNGGGMRRKNLRNVDTNTYQAATNGIDINRNFGIYQFWNSPNGGSSTSPNSDTYRGTAPFSEPETQNIMNFVNSKNFVNSLFYHSYSNLYIYPWAWSDPLQTPDSSYFKSWTGFMSGYNSYLPGVASQTVGYEVRGGSDDWLYNDSAHSKILAITPEIGDDDDGFWPDQNRIFPLVMENLRPNLFWAGASDTFAVYDGYRLLPGNTLGNGDTAKFSVKVRSVGVKDAVNVQAVIQSLDTNVQVLQGSKNFTGFSFFQSQENTADPFVIKVKDNIINGQTAKILVSLKLGPYTINRDTIKLTLGTPSVLFKDTVVSVTPLWTVSGPNANNRWAETSSDFVSPPFSYTDSPFGNYSSNVTNSLTLNNAVFLSSTMNIVKLSYNTRYQTEAGYDYGQVQISTNNGSTWIALSGKYTKPGSGFFQPNGQPLYDGTLNAWRDEEIDISQYKGNNVKLRFYFRSDGGLNYDGWYVDDICILGYDAGTSVTGTGENPFTYSLSQNYPNPFNPTTSIHFSTPSLQNVSLKVYDMLGRQVAELVNGMHQAGNYTISFNGSELSSGVYYYKLEAENFTQTKQMVLVK